MKGEEMEVFSKKYVFKNFDIREKMFCDSS